MIRAVHGIVSRHIGRLGFASSTPMGYPLTSSWITNPVRSQRRCVNNIGEATCVSDIPAQALHARRFRKHLHKNIDLKDGGHQLSIGFPEHAAPAVLAKGIRPLIRVLVAECSIASPLTGSYHRALVDPSIRLPCDLPTDLAIRSIISWELFSLSSMLWHRIVPLDVLPQLVTKTSTLFL